MAHAEICPVCQGKGSVKEGAVLCEREAVCHGCQGKGWVEVSDEKSECGPADYIVPTTTA